MLLPWTRPLGEAEVRWEGATGPLALSVGAGAGPGSRGCAVLGGSRRLLWPRRLRRRAAEEPACLPLGEPLRRTSCPEVSSGAQALKELKEERQGVAGWFSAPQGLRTSGYRETPVCRPLARGPQSRAEARLTNLFREAPACRCVGGQAAAWCPALPRNRLWEAGCLRCTGWASASAGLKLGFICCPPPAASRRGWQSCGHRAGCVLPPLLAAGPAGLRWSVVGRAWWF